MAKLRKSRWSSLAALGLSVGLALAVGAAIMALAGYNPAAAYGALLRGATGCESLGEFFTAAFTKRQFGNTAEVARSADILVSAAGVLGSLTKEYVRPGQVVIDVSINWDPNKVNSKGGKGAIAGDAVFEEVEPIVEAITPVPGGVGSVTTSVLMKHVVEAAERVHS